MQRSVSPSRHAAFLCCPCFTPPNTRRPSRALCIHKARDFRGTRKSCRSDREDKIMTTELTRLANKNRLASSSSMIHPLLWFIFELSVRGSPSYISNSRATVFTLNGDTIAPLSQTPLRSFFISRQCGRIKLIISSGRNFGILSVVSAENKYPVEPPSKRIGREPLRSESPRGNYAKHFQFPRVPHTFTHRRLDLLYPQSSAFLFALVF